MLLQTDTRPRSDGNLKVRDARGELILFKPDADGVLTGDVTCAATLELLLRSGAYYPADEADLRAAKLALKGAGTQADEQLDGMDELDDADADDDGDDEPDPVEPAKPSRRQNKRANKRNTETPQA